MDEALTRLETLLDYTLEHNREHADDLRNMAEKAQELGKLAAQADVLESVTYMDKANEILEKGIKKLR